MTSTSKKTEQDYHYLAKKRGIEWVGNFPTGVNAHTFWRCLVCTHEWRATYSHIQQGTRCPKCNKNARLTKDDYHTAGASKEIIWIGETLPLNAKEKTLWLCSSGHTWSATQSNIKQGGGCPQCYITYPKTLEDYHTLATIRGFTYLEADAIRVTTKGRWMCPNGHVWLGTYANIRKGSGCPDCKSYINGVPISKPQIAVHEITGGEMNYPVGRMRIDIALFVDDVCLAIEYDCSYWHENEEKDLRRAKALIASGWKVLRIKSKELLPTEHQLDDAIDVLLSGATYVEITLPDWQG